MSSELRRWTYGLTVPATSELKLFCFAHAGGSGIVFREWQNAFDDAIDVFPVELPGRGKRIGEPLSTNLSAIAREVGVALHPVFREGPFALFGHSMGALIAYELERLLEAEYGIQAELVVVAGSSPPNSRSDKPKMWDLPDTELIERIREMNGTPLSLLDCSSVMDLSLPIIRADCQAVESYCDNSQTPLSAPILAMGGLYDPETSHEEIKAWSGYTTAAFSHSMCAGDHFFVHSSRGLVLRRIRQSLEAIRREKLLLKARAR